MKDPSNEREELLLAIDNVEEAIEASLAKPVKDWFEEEGPESAGSFVPRIDNLRKDLFLITDPKVDDVNDSIAALYLHAGNIVRVWETWNARFKRDGKVNSDETKEAWFETIQKQRDELKERFGRLRFRMDETKNLLSGKTVREVIEKGE